jgi:hypothetical protein
MIDADFPIPIKVCVSVKDGLELNYECLKPGPEGMFNEVG